MLPSNKLAMQVLLVIFILGLGQVHAKPKTKIAKVKVDPIVANTIKAFPKLAEYQTNPNTSIDIRALSLYLRQSTRGFAASMNLMFNDLKFTRDHFASVIELFDIVNTTESEVAIDDVIDILEIQLPTIEEFREALPPKTTNESIPWLMSTDEEPNVVNLVRFLESVDNSTKLWFMLELKGEPYAQLAPLLLTKHWDETFTVSGFLHLKNITKRSFTGSIELMNQARAENITSKELFDSAQQMKAPIDIVMDTFNASISETSLSENLQILSEFPRYIRLEDLNRLSRFANFSEIVKVVENVNVTTFDYTKILDIHRERDNVTMDHIAYFVSIGVPLEKVLNLFQIRHDMPIWTLLDALRHGVNFEDFYHLMTYVEPTTEPTLNVTGNWSNLTTVDYEVFFSTTVDPTAMVFGITSAAIITCFLLICGGTFLAHRLTQTEAWLKFMFEYFPPPELCELYFGINSGPHCREYECSYVRQLRLKEKGNAGWSHPVSRLKLQHREAAAKWREKPNVIWATEKLKQFTKKPGEIPKLKFTTYPSWAQIDNGLFFLNIRRNANVVAPAQVHRRPVGTDQIAT